MKKNSKKYYKNHKSINTLCKVSGKSNKTVIRALKGLEEKHLLKKETRITKNGQSSNLYTLYDFESVWEAENIEQVSEIVNTETIYKQMMEMKARGSAELTASENGDYMLPFLGEIRELIDENEELFAEADEIRQLLLQYLNEKEATASYPYIYVKWLNL